MGPAHISWKVNELGTVMCQARFYADLDYSGAASPSGKQGAVMIGYVAILFRKCAKAIW